MSKISVKTTYESIGAYGETIEQDVFAYHDEVSGIVTFYNHDGNIILCIDDNVENNLLAAINRLNQIGNLHPMSTEDKITCGIIKMKM